MKNFKEEPEQEIVGYRLKPYIRGHIAGSLVAKMKELQVLDLWFTPIYETGEVKSDWVKQNHLDYYYKEGLMSNEPIKKSNS